jgi:very-short-patch-repair endonuclease
MKKTFANYPRSKDLVDKTIDPSTISTGTSKKYLFQCDKCPHQFEASISNIILGKFCPYCASHKICDCNICFNKSFASHPRSKDLVDKTIDASKILKGSSKKYLFQCDNCPHQFEGTISAIVDRNVSCPYCSTPPKFLCDNNECDFCFNKSFASHPKSKCIADKTIDPRQIFIASGNKLLFHCDDCNHEFEKSVYSITDKNNPSWCKYCTNQALCDCDECYNKSFASHEKSKYLVDKSIDASKIFKGTTKKYTFECNVCKNHFSMSIGHITSSSDPRWCSICKNKTEKKLYEFLKENYDNCIHQFRVDWCKNIYHLPYDICLPNMKVIIELDGRQHFFQVSNWTSPEEQTKKDIYKMQCAIENGYSVIRILQEDVCNDKIKWKDILLKNIKLYEIPVIIFIDNKNEFYKNHNVEKLENYIIDVE